MRRQSPFLAIAGLLALTGSAVAAPGRPIKPDPDSTTSPPVGAADRARNGPSPLATPPADVGAADDADDQPIGNAVAPR